MTTKLWISDKLELRHSPTGWPKSEDFVDTSDNVTGHYRDDDYLAALAKAKEESIAVDGGTIPGSLMHVLMTAEPDSFIDFDGEAEVIHQWKHTGVGGDGSWRSDSEDFCWRMSRAGKYTRKIARLKPAGTEWYPESILCSESLRGRLLGIWPQGPNTTKVTEGLKARILEAFNNITNADNPYAALEQALDELGVK